MLLLSAQRRHCGMPFEEFFNTCRGERRAVQWTDANVALHLVGHATLRSIECSNRCAWALLLGTIGCAGTLAFYVAMYADNSADLVHCANLHGQ
mmetsp:Transcript_42872/g.76921  ORF Transcript_42872/g.76921 Transcript_42872/m.76921 type:complete len:94 (-) Transcript_42872:599-880(-)